MNICTNNQKDLVLNLLHDNLRLDGRTPLSNRIINVQFFNSPGHLLYQQGQTLILIKSFLQLSAPKQQRPSQGFILFKVDCSCCNDTFDQNKKLSVQLAKLLQKNIIGSNALDPQSLCIITAKYVWKLTIQCKVINDDGNVIDSVLNGVITALADMKKPLINVDKNNIEIKQSKLQPLSIAHLPISLTFFFVDNNIFTDASYLEQLVSLTRFTITMNIYKQVCSVHKPGGMGLDQATISGAIKIMQDKIKGLTQTVRKIVKTRNTQW